MNQISAKELLCTDAVLLCPSLFLIWGKVALTLLALGVVMLLVRGLPWFRRFAQFPGARSYVHIILWGSLGVALMSRVFSQWNVFFISAWAMFYVLLSLRQSEKWMKGHR
ncbi:hypothetical protein KDD30_05725 [Photobacterium sp. GJ3]|uniref:hypothetical protein n=1 Tax=Photobacterium sp. GJ3 TaxID=2829502 RepID=UPI001B8D4F37|nr:hypothetical protein [Photobacterium sp. GJ3]QUJ68611.1 hypothetical protein KDD30_05725 [Photobacterium sp. GJ3]